MIGFSVVLGVVAIACGALVVSNGRERGNDRTQPQVTRFWKEATLKNTVASCLRPSFCAYDVRS